VTQAIEFVDGPADGGRLELLLAAPMIPDRINVRQTPHDPNSIYRFSHQREADGAAIYVYENPQPAPA
jgi:hypothetical protein